MKLCTILKNTCQIWNNLSLLTCFNVQQTFKEFNIFKNYISRFVQSLCALCVLHQSLFLDMKWTFVNYSKLFTLPRYMYVKHQLYKEWFFTGTGFFLYKSRSCILFRTLSNVYFRLNKIFQFLIYFTKTLRRCMKYDKLSISLVRLS